MADDPTPIITVRFDLANLELLTTPDLGGPAEKVSREKHVRFVNEPEILPESPSFPDTLISQTTTSDPYTTLLDADTLLATQPSSSLPSIASPPGHDYVSLAKPHPTPIIPPVPSSSQLPALPTPLMRVSPSTISFDAGETDAQGNVMQASTEACETCGGKIVWATKGEWLLVCQGCGEVQ